ncbi:unnamed protein product, partial [Polarella glacialis]
RSLADVRLPQGGELQALSLEAGAGLVELKIHFKFVKQLHLDTPWLQDLRLLGCKGLFEEDFTSVIRGCPRLKVLSLTHCADLKEIDFSQLLVPSLEEFDLSGLSRASKLETLRLESPHLVKLLLPAWLWVEGYGLRQLMLSCPELSRLDLGTLRWGDLQELRLIVPALADLKPPQSATLASFSERAGPRLTVCVSSACLELLDLEGADRLAQ